MAKRQRELAQKDRTKDREQRRMERRTRIQARVAAGAVAVTSPATPTAPRPPAGPVLGVDGPKSLAELRAAQAAARADEDAMDRLNDPDDRERETTPDLDLDFG
jgi:hypothetical protein